LTRFAWNPCDLRHVAKAARLVLAEPRPLGGRGTGVVRAGRAQIRHCGRLRTAAAAGGGEPDQDGHEADAGKEREDATGHVSEETSTL
jgi:hypothetical protein